MTSGGPGGPRGTCLSCGGPARTPNHFYCEEHAPATHTRKGRRQAARQPAEDRPGPDPSDSAPASASDGPGEAYTEGERRPTAPSEDKPKGLAARLFGDKEPRAPGAPAPRTTERRPAKSFRRSSTAEFWGDTVVGIGASMAARQGFVPMARAMQWSSPVAGDIIEEATKGTVVDKLVQPVVRSGERWEDLFDLIGFWASVGVAQANPAQADKAMIFARARLVRLLPRIAKKIKAQRAAEREAVDAMADLMPDLRDLFPDAPPDADPVELLLRSLFAAPVEGTPVET